MAKQSTESPRLKTGIPGFDELLGGGLLRGRSALIKGPPGSAKTTFGMQTLVNGALDYGEAGIYLTFEQLPAQLLADAAGFGWDLQALADDHLLKVLFITPEEVLQNPGRQENNLLVRIADWVEETGAKRLLIDSISHMRELYVGVEARASLLNFLLRLKGLGLTPILTAERTEGDSQNDVDVYLVDTVIYLDYETGGLGRPDRRTLEIIKTRGHRHVAGAHPFEIGEGGVTVYPHTYRKTETPDDAANGTRLSTGVRSLDALLDGGYTPRSAVIVAGMSGTFKTTLAGHFLLAGDDDAPPGLWITFQESRAELESSLPGRGLDLTAALDSGRAFLHEVIPGREPIEKTLHAAEMIIQEKGIGRVVIDSPDQLTAVLPTDEEREATTHWFLSRLRGLGVTTLLTQRLSRVTGRNPLSDIAMTDLADTIIYLGLVEIESRLEKVISVLKHRGGPAEGDLRAVRCTPRGLQIDDRFVGLSGVLAGAPLGKRKARIEHIFQPLYFIRDFLTMAKSPSLDDERRGKILDNLSSESEKLISRLGEYFDEPTKPAADQAGGKEGES